MVDCQAAVGKSTFSAGIEGISPRIRAFLNKNLDEAALEQSFDLIFKIRARELKIFLLSTGIETTEDFEELERLLQLINDHKRRHRAKTRVIFSITPLVKFPWTPLESGKSFPQETHNIVIGRIYYAVKKFESFEARTAIDTKEYLVSQILSRAATPKIREALKRTLDETGFVYYRNIPPEFLTPFLGNLKKEGLSVESLLDAFSFEESEKRPWAIFDTGIEHSFLKSTFEKNTDFEEIGQSGESAGIEPMEHLPEDYRARARDAALDKVKASFFVELSSAARGLDRAYPACALAAALMTASDELVPLYKGYDSSLFAKERGAPAWTTGDDILSLWWSKGAIPILERKFRNKKFIAQVNSIFASWGKIKALGTAPAPFTFRAESAYRFDPAGYFKDRGIKYTLYKKDGGSNFVLSKDSLKKNIIVSCVSKNDGPSASTVDIVPGDKFSAEEFAKEAFDYPKKSDWVRTVITASMRTADARR